MPFAPHIAGPHDPRTTTPDRAPGSVRRTTTIDTSRPGGLTGPSVSDARARDLATDPDRATRVLGEAHVRVELDGDKTILAVGGDAADLDALVGANAMRGFRRVLATAAPDDVTHSTLRHSLLDDLVGAVLVSGMAPQHDEVVNGAGVLTANLRERLPILLATQVDICAGWADDASMVEEIRRVGNVPAPLGPAAPDLEADDPEGWHAHHALAPHSTQRRRRLDVGPLIDGAAAFDAHFRDTHVDGAGVERVVHEYSVRGTIAWPERTIRTLTARVQVLPWLECPSAVASASRVVGTRAAELRNLVRTELRGTSTCTHLNDTLRALGDLDALVSLLP